VARQWYFPYGDQRHATGSLPTDYRFTGQQWQGTIALYDYGARFYDPLLGRFVSADTVVPGAGNPQNLNRYSYVRNNPLRYTDPTGHHIFEETPDDPVFVWQYPNGGGVRSTWKSVWQKSAPMDARYRAPAARTQSAQVDWTYAFPSVIGWRVEGEIGLCVPMFGPEKAVGFGPGISGGGSILLNWRSGELGTVADATPKVQVGLEGAGFNVTTGPVLSWGSSSLDPLLDGISLDFDISYACLLAQSYSMAVETNWDPASPTTLPDPLLTADPGSGSPIIVTDYFGVLGIGGALPFAIDVDIGAGLGASFARGWKVDLW